MHGIGSIQRVFTHKLSIFHKLSVLLPCSIMHVVFSFCRKHSQFFSLLPLYMMLRIVYLQIIRILLVLCTVIPLHIYIVVVIFYICLSFVGHLLVILVISIIDIHLGEQLIAIYRLNLLLWRSNAWSIRRHLLNEVINMSRVVSLLL